MIKILPERVVLVQPEPNLIQILLLADYFFLCRRDVKLVHELYFPLQASKDVAFEIGRIFMGLKDFDSAAELFRYICTHTYQYILYII